MAPIMAGMSGRIFREGQYILLIDSDEETVSYMDPRVKASKKYLKTIDKGTFYNHCSRLSIKL